MNYREVINKPNFIFYLWTIAFLVVLITAFIQLYIVITSDIVNHNKGSLVLTFGLIIMLVFLFILFNVIKPFIDKNDVEKKRLLKHAYTDSLTQILNRRAFMTAFNRELCLLKRQSIGNATLILMDLDNFKVVNDTYGHAVGDDVLRGVARTLKNNVRVSDIIARFGGEEFIFLLPDTDLASASLLCKKIGVYIKKESITYAPNTALSQVTASMGIINLSNELSFQEHLIEVDKALYKAKHSGKDCIMSVLID
ncbi:MAG: diguanylate cyclase (GGDEF)-like protein [Colwellia sp.]|jgi:diguanylate cyclase (GGDEF)-like protein